MQLLNLKGAIVTLDAMATQTEIAQQIKSGGGDYVLALKGNQGKLFQQVEGWFDQAIAGDWQGIEYSYHEKVESGHHRIETRQIWVVPVSQLPPLHRQSLWPGLTTVVMVRSVRQLWNKTTTEIRFFISSLAADAQKHAEVIRRHWSIENIAIPIVVRYRVLGFEESGVRIRDSGVKILVYLMRLGNAIIHNS